MTLSKTDVLMVNRAHLVALTTVEGALYGFTFALYIFCAWSLYLQLEGQDRRRQHLFNVVYMSLLMALALCNLAVDSHDAQTSYVEHGDYLVYGGYGYSVYIFGESPVAIVGYITSSLAGLMASAIQIWRFSIVWKTFQYSLFIVILLVLCLLTYMGLQIIAIMVDVQGQQLEMGVLSKVTFYGGQGFPLVISVAVTLLIIGRIYTVRRTHIKFMGQTDSSSPYTSVISMLVESFALESVWLIGGMCDSLFSVNTAMAIVSQFFINTQPFIQMLAYFLVVHRVAMKWGWEKDTQEKLTTLQWNQDELQTTQISTREAIPITHEEV